MPILTAIAGACERVAPLWPLTHFVAVNPFVGMSELDFEDAVTLMERAGHATLLPGRSPATRVLSVADLVDDLTPGALNGHAFVVDEISKWCSSYFDQGQAVWPMPWRHLSLWPAWRAAASLDANAELMGLRGFRAHVRALSDDPVAVITSAIGRLGIPAHAAETYLLRLLLSTAGWSGYVQYRVRERQMAGMMSDELTQLLAVRITYDVALHDALPSLHEPWRKVVARLADDDRHVVTGPTPRHDALLAAEARYQHHVATSINAGPRATGAHERPDLQAVFCIDVRSEVFRRALESQSPRIETIGFAGFFGLPLAYRDTPDGSTDARCPALLSPSLTVADQRPAPRVPAWMTDAWQSFRTSALSCFSFVEAAGLASGARLAASLLAWRRAKPGAASSLERPLPLDLPIHERVALAANVLRTMGLTRRFAKVVLLCGHGSTTANNPYGSALDCGACGGHAGDANARAAATLLNDPWVRFGLTAANIVIPADTTFIAALHNTTTDDVEVHGVDPTIAEWLAAAGRIARRERAKTLGLDVATDASLDAQVRGRSRDWSCVRPEWGLAGNAAFIAAPRARTRGVALDGRAFLHDYDTAADASGAVLELIMTAPMVVASWINLQYYASTVDNARFGSGNKVLHNVVGTFGVWQGNGGDLQVGLAWQSIHDGKEFRHEPLRLSVFLEAPTDRIDAVLEKHEPVRRLVANRWIHLLAIEPATGVVRRWAQGRWINAGESEDRMLVTNDGTPAPVDRDPSPRLRADRRRLQHGVGHS